MVIPMPVNASVEYFKAEQKFKSAKSYDEKIAALEEMISLLPKHHGSENMHAQLRARLAKLKKEAVTKKKSSGGRKLGVQKEGEAQVCIVGFTNSGKSTLLSKLTDARPEISEHQFTTKKAEIGMMDYMGIKIQLVEIPSAFQPEYLSTVRSTDAIVLVGDNKEKLLQFLKDNFIHADYIFAGTDDAKTLKERIWTMLNMLIVYTKDRQNKISPMALPKKSTIQDFAARIHKDFVKNFRFARIIRKGRIIQAGLNYKIEDGDIIEIYA